jgi:EAL domain-containing protein (putative c-di-GMP-specific phosphodiesterase class I)
VDDFGTGYSSLSYLHQLPLDTLKIDRSFVGRLTEQEGTHSIVQAIVELGHSLGLKVVAEGVETPDQLRILSRLGCDLMQGYLFARPKIAAETALLLQVVAS